MGNWVTRFLSVGKKASYKHQVSEEPEGRGSTNMIVLPVSSQKAHIICPRNCYMKMEFNTHQVFRIKGIDDKHDVSEKLLAILLVVDCYLDNRY